MKTKFGQNLSQIGALYDFYGQKNLGRQQRLSELFEFGNPERIPKSSGSGVRSEGLFSVGIRSEVVQFGRSENPEFPNPEKIDLLS